MRNLMRRRGRFFLCWALVLTGLGGGAVFLLPTVYRTAAVIEAEVQSDLWSASVAASPEGWLRGEGARFLGKPGFREVAQEFGRATSVGGAPPSSADRLRERLDTLLLAATPTPTGGGKVRFQVSGTGSAPGPLQTALDGVATLFLQEEQPQPRPPPTPSRADALRSELRALEGEESTLQGKMAALREGHGDRLQGGGATAQQTLLKLILELDSLRDQRRALRERQRSLESRLAATEPTLRQELEPAPQAAVEVVHLGTGERLAGDLLRQELLASAADSEEEAATAGNPAGGAGRAASRSRADRPRERVAELESQLAALRRILGPRNPDVIRLAREVEALRSEAPPPAPAPAKPKPVWKTVPNPAHQLVAQEIAGLQPELARLDRALQKAEASVAAHEARLAEDRAMEQELEGLRRQQDAIGAEIQGLRDRVAVAERQEETVVAPRPGATYRLVAPAPAAVPVGPRRGHLFGVAAVTALLASLLAALLRDRFDRTVKTPDDLATLTGFPVVGILPHAPETGRARFHAARRLAWTTAGLAAVTAAVVFVGHREWPLDAVRQEILRSLGAGFPF